MGGSNPLVFLLSRSAISELGLQDSIEHTPKNIVFLTLVALITPSVNLQHSARTRLAPTVHMSGIINVEVV
jgi:hypothetical protein